MTWGEIESGHRRLRESAASGAALLRQLADQGQHPQVLWIGCCDSRVVPEEIVGAKPGDLFVLRNIANIVPPNEGSDDSVGAAIEYAVLHLRVGHVVVCGHTQCGGIAAALAHAAGGHEPHVARWLTGATAAIERLAPDTPASERYLAAIKANVLVQVERLREYTCVQEALVRGELALHGWLFDLAADALWAYDEATRTWVALD
jgi:carbonic anhydrase